MFKNRLFLKFIFAYKKQILVLFCLNLLASGFFLAAPYFSKLFIDQAFINKNLARFFNLSIWGAAIFVLSIVFNLIQDVVKIRVSIKLSFDLACKVIRKFYALDLSFFHGHPVGENIYRLADTQAVAQLLTEECPRMIVDLVKIPLILAISLMLNPKLTLLLLFLTPLFFLQNLYLRKKFRMLYEESWRQGANLSKEVYEAFSKIFIIKALGLEFFKRHTYLRLLIKNIRWRIKSFRLRAASGIVSAFLSKAVYGTLSLYGGWLIIKGHLTLGSFTAAMMYLTQLGGILESLGGRFRSLPQQVVSLEKFFEVMETEPKIEDLPNAKRLEKVRGEISFSGLWFGYQKETPVLAGVKLVIPAGSWVGIVGPSGCGKTTLINLILRLYEPDKGMVSLDGVDLRMLKLNFLREQISVATQQPLLFDCSIKENISYGLKGIEQSRIEEVGRLTGIDEFVKRLSDGYNRQIGEDAFRLSQGLKQRVALARAILRNPAVLILDEATSSIDSLSEEKIFRNLRENRQGKTTIIISHRLFSVKDAQRIYFLPKDGRIEEGRHVELLSASPPYKEFFRNQEEG